MPQLNGASARDLPVRHLGVKYVERCGKIGSPRTGPPARVPPRGSPVNPGLRISGIWYGGQLLKVNRTAETAVARGESSI